MRIPVLALIASCALLAPMPAWGEGPLYPVARRGTDAETRFGVSVADPYRWLENDVRNDIEVRSWVDAENAVTQAYLATLPQRDAIKARLTELWNFERFGVPVEKGGRLFYTRNSGLENQSPLYVQQGLSGEPRLLIDPNGWAKDGATALGDFAPSDDGRLLVYTVQEGGSDWRVVKLLDVDSGQILADELRWVKSTEFAWAKDGSGFYYSRFPEPVAGAEFQSLNLDQALYFHRIGTPQSADMLVHATPATPKRRHRATRSDDGRWLIITTHEGTDERFEISVLDLTRAGSKPRTLFAGLEHGWKLVSTSGPTLTFVTDLDAPRSRVVRVDATEAAPALTELVPEATGTIADASIVGEDLVIHYLEDASSVLRRFTLDGKSRGRIALPGIGSVASFRGSSEAYYSFASFNVAPTIYRYDARTGQSVAFKSPKLPFDPKDYRVEQRFFASKDGTRVPMFVVHKAGLDLSKGAPTLLYGYGGFNISQTPSFSVPRLTWMDMGGVFVLANVRGGGEYGKAWHDGGRLLHKQNGFDDFIAAGEALIAAGTTTPAQLAVQGGSNGGTLVGAVVNQRPDLFAAALPAVGVMDMLRYDRFTAGRYWVDDYGDPAKEAHFRNLLTYSPYHNIRGGPGRSYPAILVSTADTDDRVVPGHSFKYAAALQASPDIGKRPHLIRIETRAGHGSGKPTDKQIQETADKWAFIAYHTGITGGSAR
jgi:prolyl oligopeptidase